MAIYTAHTASAQLKSYFETGKRPTESNYVNLIDSHLLLSCENTGSLNLLGNSSLDGNITITGTLTAGAGTLTSLGVGTIDVSSHITSSGNITAGEQYGLAPFESGKNYVIELL